MPNPLFNHECVILSFKSTVEKEYVFTTELFKFYFLLFTTYPAMLNNRSRATLYCHHVERIICTIIESWKLQSAVSPPSENFATALALSRQAPCGITFLLHVSFSYPDKEFLIPSRQVELALALHSHAYLCGFLHPSCEYEYPQPASVNPPWAGLRL